MGRMQDTNEAGTPARGRRLGWRTCLRKGCRRRYRARQWNQRYCGDSACGKLVRRWQATKRQRERRASPEGREKHAEAERVRRQRSPACSRPPADEAISSAPASPDGAWSRSETPLPATLCSRPGCYEPPRHSCRSPSSYCGDACREAMRRVRDRERKYLARKTKAGRLKRRLEYSAAAKKQLPVSSANPASWRSAEQRPGGRTKIAVGGYRQSDSLPVPFRQSTKLGLPKVADHDSQTGSPSRPRAPPAE
jgi:hypothetical protein